jgi:hypothetical protein
MKRSQSRSGIILPARSQSRIRSLIKKMRLRNSEIGHKQIEKFLHTETQFKFYI